MPALDFSGAVSAEDTSGNRPLLVLADLSGFDRWPESIRRRQLEYGAGIGRAVTNFKGPIVFVVDSRYHGGAFVVPFQGAEGIDGDRGGGGLGGLGDRRHVGSGDGVRARGQAAHRRRCAGACGTQGAGRRHGRRRGALAEVACEFDAIHTVERALRVGSVDRVIRARDLRPYVVDALEHGMARRD